ncbi:MAG: methyltransferase domain-containing protein [Alphaproteobacteria bacterium]|nr:methyltransferase domain-containing protein [Alphaproteobacteria bacterium]
MAGPPLVFDRRLVRRRRDRAAKIYGNHDFLHAEVGRRLIERIEPVRRGFPTALDLGARSGGLGRLLAGRFGIERLVQCELSPAMLSGAGGLRVVADEEALPFAEASFDLVVSALGLSAVNDLPGALAQIRRCLKPEGLLVAALYGGATLGELRQALAEAEIAVAGGLSPRVAPGLDPRDGAALLQRAGFAMPVADTETIVATYAEPLALLRELRGMGEGNALTARRHGGLRRDVLAAALSAYGREHAGPDGRIHASFEIVSLTGWAPSDRG